MIYIAVTRLQRVVIENKDFKKLISQYDREDSFFIVFRHIMRQKFIIPMLVLQVTITFD